MTANRDDPDDVEGLSDLLSLVRRRIGLDLHVALPARVVSYDATLQRADLSTELLAVKKGTNVKTPQVETPQEPIVLRRVPVAWPRTAAGCLTFPLVAGDTGLVVFADRSLERWKKLGKPTDPGLGHTHSLSDGVFFPGLHSNANPITPSTDLAATVLDGETLIKLGRTATEAIAKAESLIAAIDAAWAAATPALGDGGAALKSTFLAVWNAQKNSIKATKGRVL